MCVCVCVVCVLGAWGGEGWPFEPSKAHHCFCLTTQMTARSDGVAQSRAEVPPMDRQARVC